MRLTIKFAVAVMVVLLITLGIRAWVLIKQRYDGLHAEALKRAQVIASMGQAIRDYTLNTLSPAVRKAVLAHKGSLIFEADAASAVTRGTFEAFRKYQPAYVFRE